MAVSLFLFDVLLQNHPLVTYLCENYLKYLEVCSMSTRRSKQMPKFGKSAKIIDLLTERMSGIFIKGTVPQHFSI
jgi:hypothetical protein